jgi:chromate reductase, NAD(P)H dehydrogenase (quinone)
MEKITILSCTNRPNSLTQRMSLYYQNVLKAEGFEVQLLDFTALPRDIAFSETFGNRTESYKHLVQTYISEVHRFVFVIPEYNGSYPGILKVFLDSVSPKEWANKKALITGVSEGRAGNLRGIDHLTGVLNYLKINVFHNKLPISGISKVVDEALVMHNPETAVVIEQQVKGFLNF